jgi:hypothetical protein
MHVLLLPRCGALGLIIAELLSPFKAINLLVFARQPEYMKKPCFAAAIPGPRLPGCGQAVVHEKSKVWQKNSGRHPLRFSHR